MVNSMIEPEVKNNEWSDEELSESIAAYMEMLRLEQDGQAYIKTNYNEKLRQGALKARSSAAIEYRMQNISYVLENLGMPRISGYKPAKNIGLNLEKRVQNILKNYVTDMKISETNKEKVFKLLQSVYPKSLANSEIVARTGIQSHQQVFQKTEELLTEGRISGAREENEWRFTFKGKSLELVRNIEELYEGVLNFAKLERGATKENKFYRGRIKNVKRLLAFKNSSGDYIFSPGAYVAYSGNKMQEEWEELGEKVYRGRGRMHLDRMLVNTKVDEGDEGYEELCAAYDRFCSSKNIAPSKHKKQLMFWVASHSTEFSYDGTNRNSNNELVIDKAELVKNFSIPLLAKYINSHSDSHAIGQLQYIRKGLKSLSRLSNGIFSSQTIHEKWAFHHGGRKELQFNIGFEDVSGQEMVRYGVAFSFQISMSLTSVDELVPKVRLFNDFMQLYPDLYADMKMWHYKDGKRSTHYFPAAIPPENVIEGVFVFIGKLQPLESFDPDLIFADFDRLLPLYRYVESQGVLEPIATLEKETSVFTPGHKEKPSEAIGTYVEKQLNINLRHNVLQTALYNNLVKKFGKENVQSEKPSGTGCRIDMALKRGEKMWYYEIKTSSSPKACIREAFGQLFEYSLWPGAEVAERLIVVGESKMDNDGNEYLKKLQANYKLPISYEQLIVT